MKKKTFAKTGECIDCKYFNAEAHLKRCKKYGITTQEQSFCAGFEKKEDNGC